MVAEPPLETSSTGASDADAPGSRFQGVEKWEAKLIFQMNKFYFQPSTNLKLLTNKGKFNKCDFLNFVTSASGGHCDCSPAAPAPNYATGREY
jgi:hypothetical protein